MQLNVLITELPAEIGQLTNFVELDLKGTDLTRLPSEIGNLTQLTYLDLEANALSELPRNFSKLTNLTILDLSTNQLTEFLSELLTLRNLEYLDISRNCLTELPPGIGNLTKLTSLNLSFMLGCSEDPRSYKDRPRILPDVPWGDSWAKAPNASKTQNRPQPLDNHGPGFNGLGFDGQDGSSNNGEAGLRIVGGS